jgi:hypothetical protein
MMIPMFRALVLVPLILAPAPALAGAEDLLAHRAIYHLHTSRVTNSAELVGASGTLTVDYSADCSGWTGYSVLALTIDLPTGSVSEFQDTEGYFEAMDGSSLRFYSKSTGNGRPLEAIKGNADAANAVFTVPDDKRIALPGGIAFPMAQTIRLIEEARSGRRFVQMPVFSGDYERGVMIYSTIIGTPISAETAAEMMPDSAGFAAAPGWHMRHAVFEEAEAKEAEPDFEMTTALLDNGVLADFTFDYPDYTLAGRLETIEELDRPGCPVAPE